MPIYKYLSNINSGKPINFDSFCKKLHQQGYDDRTIFSIFSTEKISRLSYKVCILDELLYARLQVEFPLQTIHDRVSAAQSGDSHKHGVSQAMIILWPCRQSHPVVILNDGRNIKTPVTLSQHLLIIENQENFVQQDLSLEFLKHQFPDIKFDEFDIAHGSGNAISNNLNKPFFNRYHSIACLLDLDIGGLTIFSNLSALTNHPQLSFLLPPSASELLGQSKINLQVEHLQELRRLVENCPLLRPAIELIVSEQKMLEQEMYLQA